MSAVTTGTRARNKRGEGAQLRDDIVSAAGELLERTGRDDAVTLRAVARLIGISAPSIYHHFDDRDQILYALVTRTFDQLAAALRPAAAAGTTPVERLRAVSRAYLDFAGEHRHLYRVLFERQHAADGPAPEECTPASVGEMVGAEAFGALLDAVTACVAAGESTSSPLEAATQLWVGLHGLATLRASMPYFPWPPLEHQLDDLMQRLVGLGQRPGVPYSGPGSGAPFSSGRPAPPAEPNGSAPVPLREPDAGS